jgi:signal transduction histidine kinase
MNRDSGAGRDASTSKTGLFDMYERMLGEADIEKTLRHAMDVAQGLFRAEQVTVYFVLAETEELESVVTSGNVPRTIRLPIDPSSLAGYCAHSKRSFLVPDAYGDLSSIDPGLRFDPQWDERHHFRTRNVMCAPVVFRGELLGVAQVINCPGSSLDQAHLDKLDDLCRFVGYALYYARLCDHISTMKKLDREKAEFMRILTHELKSPVAASKSLASALRYVNQADPRVNEVLLRIEDRMDRLLGLISDILELSRIKAGTPLGEVTVVDLPRVTAALVESYRPESKVRQLGLTFTTASADMSVRMDAKAYDLIGSNLISNALKYTPAGHVAVALETCGTWAVLRVTDTGIGIPQKDIPRLFKEFFRAANAKSSGAPGTGVGLAGVKDLVERFGGYMEVQSHERQGSTFSVFLPRFDQPTDSSSE